MREEGREEEKTERRRGERRRPKPIEHEIFT